jgi:cytochrome c553
MNCPSPASFRDARSAPSPRFAGRGKGARGVALALLLLSLASAPSHAAGNIADGRKKALQCQTCHGLDGLSKLPEAPNIAGNPEPYLVRQLNAFRKGERKNEMMSVVVQQLSDQDIADLAAYYAAIEVTVKVPR